MYVKPFGYAAAESVEQACSLLHEHGPDAKLLAGGQSLVPLMNLGLAQFDLLIDGSRIAGLDTVAREDGFLRLGAMVRHRVLERSEVVRESQPLLAEAVSHVGNPRVRNRGTVGGSLAHCDAAAELPLAMSVLEAEYEASNGSEHRRIPALDFPVTFYTSQLAEDELLVSASVPVLGAGWGWGFREVSRRAGDFALAAAVAIASCRDGRIETVRLGLGGVADRPVRCKTFEAAAEGTPVEGVTALEEAIRADISPSGDHALSGEYRARAAVAMSIRAVQDACARSEGRSP